MSDSRPFSEDPASFDWIAMYIEAAAGSTEATNALLGQIAWGLDKISDNLDAANRLKIVELRDSVRPDSIASQRVDEIARYIGMDDFGPGSDSDAAF